jgi:ubiquinone/menaquinone biosynthesis C-methylase UbiE
VKKNPGGTNTGIDISSGMLNKAEKRLQSLSGANYQLKIGNAFKIEEESQRFDLLVNSYMFDLIAFNEMDSILTEFKRVLKKNGKLILANMTTGESFGSGIYSLIYRMSPKLFGGCRGVRLSEKLQQNGFQVETREYHQQLLFPSEVILALNM